MSRAKDQLLNPALAVQEVYAALEPFDDETRRRILASAASLLGMTMQAGQAVTPPPAPIVTRENQLPELGRTTSSSRPVSPRELIQDKNPKNNTQKLAVFAYYRERAEGKSRFSKADLKSYFALAKEPPPGNYDRDFVNAVRAGWIYEDGDESYLTSKGLEAVESGFAGDAGTASNQSRGPKKNTRKAGKKRAVKKAARNRR